MRNQRALLSSLTLLGSVLAVSVFAPRSGASPQATGSRVKDAPASHTEALVLHKEAPALATEQAFLKQYCVSCHNSKLKTADLVLDNLDLTNVPQSGEIMEKVVRKVWGGTMPPSTARRPDKATVNTFLASMETSLDLAAAAHPFAGRPTMLHRLNRTEYMNAVRDLLDVKLNRDDAALLPADDKGYGFDNNGDVLGVSPLLLERYLSVARKVSIAALGPPARTDTPVAIYTETVDYTKDQRKWNEGMPLGTRGGTAFSYRFPADGEYLIKIKLMRGGGRITGFPQAGRGGGELLEPERIMLGVDGKPVSMFLIRADQTVQQPPPAPGQALTDLPEPPVKELTAAEKTSRGANADDNLEIRIPQKAGEHQITTAFLARYVAVPAQLREPYEAGRGADARPMGIYSVVVTGPYNSAGPGDTTSRRRIFTCHPANPAEEAPCEKTILTRLATSAYRRPVTRPELEQLLTAYERGRKDGGFEDGFGLAIRRLLMDPAFLFRVERDPAKVTPGVPYRVSDLELASRLSFFLWSSLPDDELLKVAERGQLKDPAVLEHQVRRMLADPRATSLVDNFASEWLSLRVVEGVLPDPVIFSDFDGLKEAFVRETDLFLENVLLGNRNVLELLNADYTFVNERLARHYGIPNVYGAQFRKVTFSDGIRGGLLGQGGILTATSYPNRTSPVLRGQWVLNNILGSPAPPPPPDIVRDLDDPAKALLPMRERMAEHRANPACAGCHSRMDPLGLALENFDATGKWRAGATTGLADLKLQPIDASGELADGTKFEGIAGLKKVLLARSDEFVYTMSERLFTYALGRGADWYDAPYIRAALRAAKQDDYHFSTLVLSVVRSTPFQMRMPREAEPAAAIAESAAPRPKTSAGN